MGTSLLLERVCAVRGLGVRICEKLFHRTKDAEVISLIVSSDPAEKKRGLQDEENDKARTDCIDRQIRRQ